MKADQTKWNAKYGEPRDEVTVADCVKRFHSLAPDQGLALDLAAGLGANSLYLADQGFEVEAVDISDIAMGQLKGRHPHVTAICEDLDFYTIPEERYDLILSTHFLNRRLFPLIIEGLKPGGVVIIETFMEGDRPPAANDAGAEAPTNRDYLLRPNELLLAFLKLHVLYYEEKDNVPPIRASHLATLVARR